MGYYNGHLAEHGHYIPSTLTDRALPDKTVGNRLNGLGEAKVRRPSRMFPAPGDKSHPLNKWLLLWAFRLFTSTWRTGFHMILDLVHTHIRPRRINPRKIHDSPENFTRRLKEYALSLPDVDIIGITNMKEEYIYQEDSTAPFKKFKWVVMIGRAMDYEQAKKNLDGDFTSTVAQVFGGYEKSKKAAVQITNWIRAQGYAADGHGGFDAAPGNILMGIPAAIDAGLGQLGKNGSMLSDKLGSAFRLADIVTDIPLIPDAPYDNGADDFCLSCQACTNHCPPGAISDSKQLVRGVEKWYVDFDKCAPFMSEKQGCALCLTSCPWSMPGVAGPLSAKMLKRRQRQTTAS